MADIVNHLQNISLKKLFLGSDYLLTTSDITALLVGGLGQSGTLEELGIGAWRSGEQVGSILESIAFVVKACGVSLCVLAKEWSTMQGWFGL